MYLPPLPSSDFQILNFDVRKKDQVARIGVRGGGRWFRKCLNEKVFFPLMSSHCSLPLILRIHFKYCITCVTSVDWPKIEECRKCAENVLNGAVQSFKFFRQGLWQSCKLWKNIRKTMLDWYLKTTSQFWKHLIFRTSLLLLGVISRLRIVVFWVFPQVWGDAAPIVFGNCWRFQTGRGRRQGGRRVSGERLRGPMGLRMTSVGSQCDKGEAYNVKVDF